MAHYQFGANDTVHATPNEWLKVGSTVGVLCNGWASRGDLVAFVAPNIEKELGAAAAFFPNSAEIVVDTARAFGDDPAMVGDLKDRKTQFKHAKGVGAIFHEAMHSRFTTWDLKEAHDALTQNEFDALVLLEESRMEGFGLVVHPKMRAFLRACVVGIVMGDTKDEDPTTSTRAAARLAALLLARIDTGVLKPKDIQASITKVEATLDEDLLGKLRDLWLEFQIQRPERPAELARMYEIAVEWNKLVQEAAEENGEGAERENGDGFEGDGKGGGEISEAMAEAMAGAMGEILDALGEDAGVVEITATDGLHQQEQIEDMEARAQEHADRANEREANSKVFQKMKKTGPGPADTASRSRITQRRQPTSSERRAAVTLGREFDRAKYQDRIRTEANSVVPPGRLRMGTVMQGAAYRSMGNMTATEPFRRVQRKHVDDPKLSIGVMVDISGSMGGAMEPMASAAWIMSEASKRVEATLAMVYYGNDVFPTLLPGQHLDKVNVYSASDGTEKAGKALMALDGALDLLWGSGARLVVIVSDGQHVPIEQENIKEWFKKFAQAGVAVLWLGYGYSSEYAEMYCKPYQNVQYVGMGKDDPAAAALVIGQAAVKAINAAGLRR